MMLAILLALATKDFPLQTLDLSGIRQGWGEPQVNKSVGGNPLTIHRQIFSTGVGTHAASTFRIDLGGRAESFHAMVGLDAEAVGQDGSVQFKVIADGTTLWQSTVMHASDLAQEVKVDLRGKKTLTLQVGDAGDGINWDHADWADAGIVMISGTPRALVIPVEKPYIWTPKPKASPRLTGPTVFGATPGNPFLYTVTATGDRPMIFTASRDLPPGLSLDPGTGQISGIVGKMGTWDVKLTARNARGESERRLRIVIGDKIGLTPPLGWNSWNCWGDQVSQEKVLISAHAMAAKLKDHGWSYVNMDDGWQGARGGEFGGIQPNKKFPDMPGMIRQIHAMGLKAGIYSTPWAQSYAGYIGGSSDQSDGDDFGKEINENHRYNGKKDFHHMGKFPMIDRDAKQWAAWGIDYLKYDWNPLDPEHVGAMTTELRKSGRDIFYSLSNSADWKLRAQYAALSNSWRTTGDINDSWGSLAGIWAEQDKWFDAGAPSHWNDPDMLVVGKLGWGNVRPTKLTPSEQYSHISLWCLLSAPLLLGCDLGQLDDFTLNLLTNDDVLDIDQDALGRDARRIRAIDGLEVWSKEMEDGSRAVGLFNQNEDATTVSVKWSDLGIHKAARVRDLWRQKDLGVMVEGYSAKVPRHGVVLVRVWMVKD